MMSGCAVVVYLGGVDGIDSCYDTSAMVDGMDSCYDTLAMVNGMDSCYGTSAMLTIGRHQQRRTTVAANLCAHVQRQRRQAYVAWAINMVAEGHIGHTAGHSGAYSGAHGVWRGIPNLTGAATPSRRTVNIVGPLVQRALHHWRRSVCPRHVALRGGQGGGSFGACCGLSGLMRTSCFHQGTRHPGGCQHAHGGRSGCAMHSPDTVWMRFAWAAARCAKRVLMMLDGCVQVSRWWWRGGEGEREIREWDIHNVSL